MPVISRNLKIKEVPDVYQKILVPLDGSTTAECALSHVKNLVKDGAAGEVTLLNVVNVYPPLRGEYTGRIDIDTMRERIFTESRKYLAEVESRLASEGIKVKVETLEGNQPADTISDYARKTGVNMIVIATHGYTGLRKLMFGSVALGVLHESHLPILLIRPES